MALPAVQGAVVGAVAPRHIGTASGVITTVRQLGGAFGVAIVVAVFAGTGSYASPQAFSDGFGPALGVTAALSLAGGLVALAMPAPARVARPEAVIAGDWN